MQQFFWIMVIKRFYYFHNFIVFEFKNLRDIRISISMILVSVEFNIWGPFRTLEFGLCRSEAAIKSTTQSTLHSCLLHTAAVTVHTVCLCCLTAEQIVSRQQRQTVDGGAHCCTSTTQVCWYLSKTLPVLY